MGHGSGFGETDFVVDPENASDRDSHVLGVTAVAMDAHVAQSDTRVVESPGAVGTRPTGDRWLNDNPVAESDALHLAPNSGDYPRRIDTHDMWEGRTPTLRPPGHREYVLVVGPDRVDANEDFIEVSRWYRQPGFNNAIRATKGGKSHRPHGFCCRGQD
jgi:hypothetical protein